MSEEQSQNDNLLYNNITKHTITFTKGWKYKVKGLDIYNWWKNYKSNGFRLGGWWRCCKK